MAEDRRETKLIKAYCPRSGIRYGLMAEFIGGVWKVVNMIELTEQEARITVSEVRQASFDTNVNLLPCPVCGSRRVGGCTCAKRQWDCKKASGYNFGCLYCKELTLDYSAPTASDLRAAGVRSGDKVQLAQGKEVKVITFSNAEWKKFDNVSVHDVAPSSYHEPRVHVAYSEKDIEFHGYNVSKMDEGVYYQIGENDDFTIECDVDTTTIKPHPGGYFYIDFGLIQAKITQEGGRFTLDGRQVATVGARFKMKLSLVDGGAYSVEINGVGRGTAHAQTGPGVKVIFGFAHDGHYCELLSHAYIKNIRMSQGVSR